MTTSTPERKAREIAERCADKLPIISQLVALIVDKERLDWLTTCNAEQWMQFLHNFPHDGPRKAIDSVMKRNAMTTPTPDHKAREIATDWIRKVNQLIDVEGEDWSFDRAVGIVLADGKLAELIADNQMLISELERLRDLVGEADVKSIDEVLCVSQHNPYYTNQNQ